MESPPYDTLEEREREKRHRSRRGLAITSRSVFGLREELDRAGCLWVPGKDEQGVSWVEGGDKGTLVALAPDDETKERLMETCARAERDYESLAAAPGFDPDPELMEARRRFAANRNYLRAWASSAGGPAIDGALSVGIAQTPSPQSSLRSPHPHDTGLLPLRTAIQDLTGKRMLGYPEKRPDGDKDNAFLRQNSTKHGKAGTLNQGEWEKALKNALFSSWSAEFMMTLQQACMPDEQLIRVSNNWAIVQMYYALHHLVQALQVAVRLSPSDDHGATRRAFRLQWQLVEGDGQHDVFATSPLRGWLSCWRLSRETGGYAYHIGREAVDLGPQTVHLLAPFDPLDATYLISRCLESTYGQAIEGKPKAQRDAHQEMYTIIDYLYRFRCKRNYGDNISLVRGVMNAGDARGMQEDFIYLASASALLYEQRIMAMAHLVEEVPLRGKALSWMEQWLSACADGLDETLRIPLRERLTLHREAK